MTSDDGNGTKERKTSGLPLDTVARRVSALTYPTFYSIPVFLVLSVVLSPWPEWPIIAMAGLLFATVAPVAIVLAYTGRTRGRGLDIDEREARIYPLLLILPCYLAGSAALYLLNAPVIIQTLMLCYSINTLFVLIVSAFWKISIHAVGVAGPAAALVFVLGNLAALPVGVVLVVMWSRVRLRKHTVAQVVAGALSGFIITGIVFLLVA